MQASYSRAIGRVCAAGPSRYALTPASNNKQNAGSARAETRTLASFAQSHAVMARIQRRERLHGAVKGAYTSGREVRAEQIRHYAAARPPKPPGPRVADKGFNFQNSLNLADDLPPDHEHWRRVTATDLSKFREPPTRVKMLVRDFIDDSLYNPHYGYFSRNATIFAPPSTGYDFPSFRDAAAFQVAVARRYEEVYGREVADQASQGGLARQVWHTPTELFKPYYAQALVSAILSTYKLNHFPYQDLIIYEVGAGNGSFMLDALAFIRDQHPDVFERTRYKVIEISKSLAEGQKRRAAEAGFGKQVEVVNADFFSWEGGGDDPCFVVALEVFDNFAHDMIRYELSTLRPLQAVVCINASGDFALLYEPITDPLLVRHLSYRRILPPSPSTLPPLSMALRSQTLRNFYTSLPLTPNLSKPDFIPTKATLFLERLRDRLPQHRLLLADFSSLPDAVPGRNGPVVQTRFNGDMIPCETFLVKPGFFDIFFPTDFELLKQTYSLIMNSPARSAPPPPAGGRAAAAAVGKDFFTHGAGGGVRGFRRRDVRVYDHADFLRTFGGEEVMRLTKTRDGESVMEGMYRNAKVMF